MTSNEIINQLDALAGKALAMIYANPLIEQNSTDGEAVLKRKLLNWIPKKIPAIAEAIQEFKLGRSTDTYPNPYNQAIWGDHLNAGEYARDNKAAYEKHIARGLFFWQKLHRRPIPTRTHLSAKQIGTIQDYEVPLIYTGKQDSGRKIDLISTRIKNDELIILELKNNRSSETLLRCLLEAFTYSLIIDRKRAKESFGVSQNATTVICPLIFEGTSPHQDLLDNIENCKRDFFTLIETMQKIGQLKIRFEILRESDWVDDKGTVKFPASPTGRTTFKAEWLQPRH